MKRFIQVADDLTGAADAGSYFTDRGIDMTIYTQLEPAEIPINSDMNVTVNLSTRNTSPDIAEKKHLQMFGRIMPDEDTIIMKKIGTGFRGRDQYELNGILEANEKFLCFVVDSAPELNTFTLYGSQYCEGCILTKSLYANDPIIQPVKSYIPDILAKGSKYKIINITIDMVRGSEKELIYQTDKAIKEGGRILVFDSITKEDVCKIVSILIPLYPKAVWTGSLGLADALAGYIYGGCGVRENNRMGTEAERSICFTASAYEATRLQIEYSLQKGLKQVGINVDKIMDGQRGLIDEAVAKYVKLLKENNVILFPVVERYSYKPGTSIIILDAISECAKRICEGVEFDRLAIIGGETSQSILKRLNIHKLSLQRSPELGVSISVIQDGSYRGKRLALKGGSIGSIEAMESMLKKGISRQGE